jgi:hypothetical protein
MNDTNKIQVGDVIRAVWGNRYVESIEGDRMYGTSDAYEGEGCIGLVSEFMEFVVQTEPGVWEVRF